MSQDVLKIMAERLAEDATLPDIDLTPDALAQTPIRTLGYDSLKLLQLLMHVEDTLGVEGTEEQYPDDTLLGDVAAHYAALSEAAQG